MKLMLWETVLLRFPVSNREYCGKVIAEPKEQMRIVSGIGWNQRRF